MPDSVGRRAPEFLHNSGGGTGGNGTAAASSVTSTDITRNQWQHFLDFYRPLEDEVLRKAMQTDFSAEGDVAGQTAAQGVRASRGTLARQLSRSGVSLTAEEQAAVSRRQGVNLATAVSRAENTTRRGLSASREELLARVVGIGRQVARTASAGLQSADDLKAGRDRALINARSGVKQGNIAAGSTLAALAIAFI